MATANTWNIQLVHRHFSSEKCVDPSNAANIFNVHAFLHGFVNKATCLRLQIPKRKVKMNVCSIWLFAQIPDDFYYLDIWQCVRYFVAAIFKELALITTR